MASKQLEILVNARDNASGVFKGVGNSAQGLSSKLGSLDSLTSSAKGFKSSLKVAKTLVVAYETIPLAIDTVTAAYATLTGSAEEAAAAQRTLLEGIKSFPIVGKIAGGVAEYLGTKVAHIFGKQSTAEMEADIAKNKAVMEGYAVAAKKIGEDLIKNNNEVALLGLAPGDAAIEKAKQQYAKTIKELKPLKESLIKAAGQQTHEEIERQEHIFHSGNSSPEEKAAAATRLVELQLQTREAINKKMLDLKTIEADAEKIRDDEIQKAQQKKIISENDFSAKIENAARERHSRLSALQSEFIQTELAADNREYEARQATLRQSAANAASDVQSAYALRKRQLETEITSLRALAAAGNEEAKNQIKALNAEKAAEMKAGFAQLAQITKNAGAEQRAEREKELRDDHLSALRIESDAGDENAKLEIERLTNARERQAVEKALAALSADEKASDKERAEANRLILEYKKAEVAESGGKIRDSGLFLLRQEASLGDHIAERQLKQFEIAKEYNAEKTKLLALLKNENLTDQQKKDVKKELSALDAVEKRALAQAGTSKLSGGATLEESQFLTGVSAAGNQQRDEYQPIVDAQKENVVVSKEIADLLRQYLKMNEGGGTELK